MNKNLYRIVFNRALGLFQVVAEIARRNGPGGSDGTTAAGSRFLATVRPLRFAIALALGQAVVVPMANAQVVADPSAPGNQRPTVLEAANGVPLVNIQTPSAAGVSRNTYRQFDVDQQGAILNNSRANTQTELGGWVQGNPWLARGTARVILNEVNSSNPSQLRGYVEVAGDRAQLVIANPAGISCDGCGFINADRSTLTTGKPIINGGSLEGYRVEGGAIQIGGNGMDASTTNYTDLIARSVQANAGIWAQQLQVTTGTNEVSADHTQVQKIAASGDTPAFALDVGALGGMYSQKIVLVGTEHGVGMRNVGTIGAGVGQLVVTADGRLENSGTMQARTDTRIDASGGLANAGTVSAGRELLVNTAQDIDNSQGTLNARRIEANAQSLKNRGGAIEQTGTQDLVLSAAHASNREGGRIGLAAADTGMPPGDGGTPGTGTDGTGGGSTGNGGTGGDRPGTGVAPLANGALNIAATFDNDGGRIMAGGDVDLTAKAGLDNDGGHLGTRRLDVSGGDVSNRRGEIKVAGDARIAAGQLNNDAGLMQLAGPVALSAQDFSNRAGTFQHSDKSDTHIKVSGRFDNSDGTLASNANRLTLDAGQLVNTDGQIAHSGDGGLVVNAGTFSGAGGETATAGAARLRLGDSDHRNATLSARQVDLQAQSFDNRGGKVIATGNQANRLDVSGTLDNGDGGTIVSNADLGIRAGSLGNAQGNILHAGDGRLDIDADTLRGENGSIASNGKLTLKGDTTDLTGATTQAKAIKVDTGVLTTAQGKLIASGTGPLEFKVRGAMDNNSGIVAGNGAVDLRAKSLDNRGGTVSAAGTEATRLIVTDKLDNSDGTVAAAGDTTVKAGALVNQGGAVVASGDSTLAVTVDGKLDNSAGGMLAAGGDLTLKSASLENRKGTIQQAGGGSTLAVTTGELDGAGGTLVSKGALDLKAGNADLSGGTTQADKIAIAADSLSTAGASLVALGSDTLDVTVAGAMDNRGGVIAGNGAVNLKVQSLDNHAGKISAAGSGPSTVQVAQQLDNTDGSIAAAGDTTVMAGDLTNRGGSVVASGQSALTVDVAGTLDNRGKGTLAAGGDMTVSANTLDNREGSIQHAGDGSLLLTANALLGAGGTIATNGGLNLSGETTDLHDATTLARRINIDTGSLTTAGGSLTATGTDLLTVRARDHVDNTGGTIATNGGLDLQARSLDNQAGTMSAAGSAATRVAVTDDFDNTDGTLATAGDTKVTAAELHNQRGSIVVAGQAALEVTVDGLLDNRAKGTLAAGGDLNVSASVLDNRDGAIQHAGDGSATIVAADLQGAGGSIGSNGALDISGNTTDLSDGSTFGERIRIDTGRLLNAGGKLIATGADLLLVRARDSLDNTGGTIAGNGALDIQTGSLTNRDGSVQAAGDAATRVDVARTLDNTGGTLAAAGATTVKAGELVNQAGKVQTANDAGLAVEVAGNLDNRGNGVIVSSGKTDVRAGSLDNRGGAVNAAGPLTTTVQETLDNRGGKLVSAADLGIQAGMLDNRDGGLVVSTDGKLAVDTRGRTENAGGTLQGGGHVSLANAGLGNAGGTVLGANVDIDTRLASLDNAGGTIASTRGALGVNSGALNNAGGLLQSAQGMRVDTHGQALVNTNAGITGGILSGDTLALNSGSLNNRGGVVHGQGDFIARTGGIDNTAGQLGGSANVDIGATSLSSAGGKVQAGKNLTANLSGVANNNGGLMVAGDDLKVNAAEILNRDTQSADANKPLGLQGDSVLLTANRTDNTAGTIAADSHIGIRGTGAASLLDNTRGSISSGGSIDVAVNRVLNQAGTLLAGKSLGVTADTLGGDGSLLSKGDLSLVLQQDFTNLKEITVNGRALISTAGLLTNHSLLQAGDLEVRGTNVNNTVTGEMSGGRTTVVASNTLTNRGLIDGGQTRIDAGTLDNVGTGRVYGDHLAIRAGTLNNREEGGRAAVIAARQRLDIGASFINNREQALIFSAGSSSDAMNIGGTLDANYQATGRAGLILNDSATIESLGGLTIDSARLLNRNLHFRTELAQVGGPTKYLYIQPKGDPNKHSADEYRWEKWSRAGRYRHKETGAQVRAWTQYDVTQTEYETQVIESAPALIRSGGNMTLRGDELVNDKSQIIAGGVLQGDLDRLNNVAAFGEHVTRQIGTSQYTYSRWRGGLRRYHQRRWDGKIAYTPADLVQTVELDVSRVVQNAAGGGSGFVMGGRQTGQVSASVGDSANAAGGASQKQITEVQAQVSNVLGPNAATGTQVTGGNGPVRVREQDVAGNNGPHQAQADTLTSTDGPGFSQGAPVDALAGPGQASGQNVADQNNPDNQQGGTVNGASSDAPMVIRTVQVDTDVPANSLFRTGPNAGGYLIETDPRFADYRNWLSSDYMLSQLGYDPANMHKRLGDGFYEQKLVRDQIGQLTGRRFLEGYASDEAQYRALLEAGSTFAKAWNLRPGVALSAEQMAQLTSDIVWLVERDVTLADGTTTRALVPQVYVRVKPGDIDGRGTMLAANAIDLNLKGDLVNSGTIAGRTAVKLTSENLRNLGGRITGDAVALTARTDIDNIGGTLDASSTLLVNAGRDLNVATTTHSDAKQAGRSDFSRTNIDRVAGLYVTSPGGILLASAGRDANLIAAQIINSGRDGQTAIIAGRDLTLGTVKIAEQENNVRNASNYLKQGYVQDVGTNITTAGDVRLQAGRDLTAIAATVTSEHGALVAVAQGDVNILAGEASRNWSEGRQHKSRSLLGSSKKTSRDSLEETKAVSSTFSGNTVAVQGQNVTVTGSNVVSDAGTVIVARNDLTIQAATETSSESHFREAKKSGVFSGGGVGFTVGKQMQSDDQKVIRTTAASSTVGSISGDVNLAAGNQYRQIGSDILAPEGDISVVAKNIEISEARQSSQAEQESKFKQSGLTVSLSSPIINAVETTSKVVNATRETDSGRMKALGSAMAGLNAYDAYAAGSDIAKAVKNGEDPRKAASVGINISAGSSKSESRTTQTTETAHGSTVKAGGSVSLVATGAGQDSNILIRGSEITAGKNATLMADNRVDLVAAENHEQMQGKRSSSSASVGVGINFGGDQNGITLNASGSKGRGKSNGKDNWYTNSRLNARDTVLISSGSDTNIRGAGVAGNTVKLDVGGDLNIESLQNTNTYTSKDKTTGAGISVCIPPLCAGTPVSANINIQKAKATGNYASVEEQSGIQAGDGGFDIRVKGNTDLKGALIASNQAAIDAGKNRLETASLTTSDIQNRAKASAKSSGISLSSDYLSQGKYGIGKTLIGNAMDSGSAADSSTGITKTAVSNATVIITDESKQKELTGTDAETTVAALNRDTVNAHVAAQKIDIKELEQQARAEQVIKTAVTAQAFKFSDDAYRTMFLDEHPIYRVELNAEGKVVFDEFGHAVVHKLSPEEKANMQAGSGGQVRVGVNGIFNDADAAAYYADQHNGGVVQPLYIVHFPQADSMVGELMVAGYQKFLENNFWGLSNSTQEVQNLMRQYGISGLLLDAHSRGSMTVGNAMGSLINDGDSGILANTDINFYGPAFSAQRAADLLYQLSGGTKDLVNLQNHKDDFVGSILGGNPATHSLRPDSSNKVKEWIRMFSSPNTVHSCYGFAGRECTDRYNDARTIEIRTRIER
ncbi:hemagglutinin repeat-containing protein [Pseudomonas aeruginosa]|uniref:two-partner secretion domain-containing protein n=1 Tax=Pseudomonas aeruginosa TaxID=287 RepID=UPI003005EB9A